MRLGAESKLEQQSGGGVICKFEQKKYIDMICRLEIFVKVLFEKRTSGDI